MPRPSDTLEGMQCASVTTAFPIEPSKNPIYDTLDW